MKIEIWTFWKLHLKSTWLKDSQVIVFGPNASCFVTHFSSRMQL